MSKLITSLTLILVTSFHLASAADEVVNTNKQGVAIKGYDPVAYFTAGKPVKGTKEFTAQYQGATYHFYSAETRDLFAANPEKYAPVYGGYCAYGVSQGGLFDIAPDAWSIVDGKLILNLNQGVQKKFNEDPAGYLKQADQKWPGLAAEKKGN